VKYMDEYRNPQIAHALAGRIAAIATRPWVLMEVCGGQTHTLMRYGIGDLLPKGIELVHGPGCPVCVTPLELINQALRIAAMPNVIFTSYGDMLRVPGSHSDLFRARADGADVRIVYSPMDALKIAEENPQLKVVFFAVGFETTAPANAMAVWQARRRGVRNFSILVSHVLVPPAMRLILESPMNRVQGFIAPGHVCSIAGFKDYEQIANEFEIPIVVGGFEPVDLLDAIYMLVAQLEQGRAEVENQYSRSVSFEGNIPAQEIVKEVFTLSDRKWRGIGQIAESGLKLRDAFRAHDAECVFNLSPLQVDEPAECISALVLQGRAKPADCPAFGTNCTPMNPLGALMVSSEGACAAWHQYKRHA